MLLMLLV